MPEASTDLPTFGTAVVTLDGVIIRCDETYGRFIGMTPAEAAGRSISEFAGDSSGGSPEMMISILTRTGEPLSVRRTPVRPDGTSLPVVFQLSLLLDGTGRPHSVFSVGQIASGS